MQTIKLMPAVFEPELVPFLAVIWKNAADPDLEVDFTRAHFYIPMAVTALLARIDYARSNGGTVKLIGLRECKNFHYLQRIDFFNQLGIELEEDFVRHAPGTAFVPLREIPLGLVTIKNDEMATELAACMAGAEAGDVFQLSQYALGEVIANVKQHAERPGFACAQRFQRDEMSRIGIADCGVGLRESFRRTGSPKFRQEMNDLQVLELAMAPYGSSKAHVTASLYGETANKGLGLTMTRFMAAETYGHFFLSSGKAWWYRDGLAAPIFGEFADGISVQGTVVSAAFQRSQVTSYAELRQQAWNSLGLTLPAEQSTLFT
jgi:hypothetical protein